MLPLGASLRRLAARSYRLAAVPAASRAVAGRALSRPSRRFLHAPARTASASFPADGSVGAVGVLAEDAAEEEEEEVSAEEAELELELEPLEAGLAGQRPLSDFDLSPALARNLEAAGITHLFPVQAQSFSTMLRGAHILGRSKTGSGKTLAFALPVIEKLLAERAGSRHPRALVLLPTRELAQQVAAEIRRVAPQLRTADIVGGVSYSLQEGRLRRGADIVVGTPGRIMDLVNKGSLSLAEVQTSVLDEADMMLKFGFQEAVETILGWTPADQQCVMWSATFPAWVNAMARKFLREPVSIDLVGREDTHVPATVAHKAIRAPPAARVDLLESVLRQHANGGQCLVFTETKQEADEIANRLGRRHVRALHGDLSQGMRSATMDGFRAGSVRTLVCTDIAARGLDIASVDLVVQFRLPSDKESFVHRAGRTGRAGRAGTNIVFFDRQDAQDVLDLERRFHLTFAQVAPPAPELAVDAAVGDARQRLDALPPASARLFEDAAQRLLAERGPNALGAALALLCGFDGRRLQSLSMLTGRARVQTVAVEGVGSARELNRALAGFGPDGQRADIHPLDGRLLMDVPHGAADELRAHLAAAGLPDVRVAPATELPRVLIDKRAPAAGRSASPFKRGGRDRDRDRDRNRDGSRRRGASFDSNFSRGRAKTKTGGGARAKMSAGGNAFGRYREGGGSGRGSDRGDRWSKSW